MENSGDYMLPLPFLQLHVTRLKIRELIPLDAVVLEPSNAATRVHQVFPLRGVFGKNSRWWTGYLPGGDVIFSYEKLCLDPGIFYIYQKSSPCSISPRGDVSLL